jgi:glucan phosphoethanolaminetransferase (alkaline phosphatase superfamily)
MKFSCSNGQVLSHLFKLTINNLNLKTMYLLLFFLCIFLIMVLPVVANYMVKQANNHPNQFGRWFLSALVCWVVVFISIYHSYYNVLKFNREPCEYQLIIYDEGYLIKDQYRKVGFVPAGNTALDSLLIDDNQ